MTVFLISLWFLIGFLSFVYLFAKDKGSLSVGTILFSIFGSFCGLFVTLCVAIQQGWISDFLSIKIWERKRYNLDD
jgi:hypothetical protein